VPRLWLHRRPRLRAALREAKSESMHAMFGRPGEPDAEVIHDSHVDVTLAAPSFVPSSTNTRPGVGVSNPPDQRETPE